MIGGGMHGFGFGGFGWLGMLLGLLFYIAVFVGVIVLVVWLVKRMPDPDRSPPAPPAGAGAVEILKSRYARGEITREQYHEMLADIS